MAPFRGRILPIIKKIFVIGSILPGYIRVTNSFRGDPTWKNPENSLLTMGLSNTADFLFISLLTPLH
jgi:hypothetical protein